MSLASYSSICLPVASNEVVAVTGTNAYSTNPIAISANHKAFAVYLAWTGTCGGTLTAQVKLDGAWFETGFSQAVTAGSYTTPLTSPLINTTGLGGLLAVIEDTAGDFFRVTYTNATGSGSIRISCREIER